MNHKPLVYEEWPRGWIFEMQNRSNKRTEFKQDEDDLLLLLLRVVRKMQFMH